MAKLRESRSYSSSANAQSAVMLLMDKVEGRGFALSSTLARTDETKRDFTHCDYPLRTRVTRHQVCNHAVKGAAVHDCL